MPRRLISLVLAMALALPGGAWGADVPDHTSFLPRQPDPEYAPRPEPRGTPPETGAGPICDLIAAEAERTGIPAEFFARLIWKESRFDIRAVSPKGAQGVAQFMPDTARLRGLADPFDPAQAIAASAAYLADLREMFGNLGLAAAAYNSGENRVARWLAQGGYLPGETIDYVHSITFRPVDWFREDGREVEHRPLAEGKEFDIACRELPVIATRALASAAVQPWGVRVAGGISHSAAARAYRRAARLYPSVLGGVQPMILRSRRAGAGRYVALVGAPSQAEARRICNRLRALGGPCVVMRS